VEDSKRYIDALAGRERPSGLFTRELLAEADDRELQQVVKQAANELKAPIALVTLVLDQIQFFKAHYGLPEDLAAARGSRRDASFCQFVVRDGETFEVQDAPNDSSVPQYFVQEYDISSYLGVPIRLDEAVIGSLCVLDTNAREFSKQERADLEKLATLVEERVRALTERRRRARADLSEQAAGSALADLSATLLPAIDATQTALAAVPAIRSFLNLAAHAVEGGKVSTEVMKSTLSGAEEALLACEDSLYDALAASGDCGDSVDALSQLTTQQTSGRLSELLEAAQDLSRPSTRDIGGAPLPDLPVDPIVGVPRSLAVALLTASYTNLASGMSRARNATGISTKVRTQGSSTTVRVSAEGIGDVFVESLAAELKRHIGDDPSLTVAHAGAGVEIVFKVVGT
jgi:hypothetical protein